MYRSEYGGSAAGCGMIRNFLMWPVFVFELGYAHILETGDISMNWDSRRAEFNRHAQRDKLGGSTGTAPGQI
jgi:hypothetical protein